MSCRCPIQPDYCVDEPVTEIDCWECPTCRISMTAVDLGIVLRHKDRLIERLHATRSTLMEERNSAIHNTVTKVLANYPPGSKK